ncbi:MAG: NHL repeat-containing protein [Thiomonas sp.]
MPITRRQTLQWASSLLLGASPFASSTATPASAAASSPGERAGQLSLFAGQIQLHGHTDGPVGKATFFDPRGLAVDPRNGDIILADAANALIRRITPAGEVSTLAGGAEDRVNKDGPALQARFVGPDALAVALDGTIYIADSYANTIRVLRNGEVSTLAGQVGRQGYADGQGTAAQFNHPVGIAVDPRTGDVLVADAYNNTLRRISPKGRVRTIGGQPGVNDHRDGLLKQALFNTPVGIAVAPDGTIYVSEFFNQDVRKITPQGMVGTLAGNPAKRGDTDGRGVAALFRKPQQLCLDAHGNIILADGGNHKVRRITPAGEVTTLAGQGQLDKVELGPLPGALITPYGVAPGPQGSVLVSSGEAVLRITQAA